MDVVWADVCLFALESDDEYFDAEDGDLQTARTVKASELKKASEVPNEELVNLLLKFEIKEVCAFLFMNTFLLVFCTHVLEMWCSHFFSPHLCLSAQRYTQFLNYEECFKKWFKGDPCV